MMLTCGDSFYYWMDDNDRLCYNNDLKSPGKLGPSVFCYDIRLMNRLIHHASG